MSQMASLLAECPDCELLEELNASLRNVLDRHAPLVTRTDTARPSAPWITEEVKAAERNLRKAERRWRSSGLNVHKQIFIEHRNVKKRIILSAKRKHFCENLSKCNSSKYELTNKLFGNSKSSVFPNDIPEFELSDHFCSFFYKKNRICWH